MLTLDELALKFGTDKGSTGHNYCPIYERLFEAQRHEPVKLLELGVWKGASLQMWAEYFDNPDSDICGIDMLSSPFETDVDPRIRVYKGDQTETPAALEGWCPEVVIDDAAHLSPKIIESFALWFPKIEPGGLYIVEDISATYYQKQSAAMMWFQKMTDQVHDWKLPNYERVFDIESITFRPDLVIVKKKEPHD